MDEPTATAMTFAPPDAYAPDGSWALEVTVQGTGFVERSLGLMALVGDVPVQYIMPVLDGAGFTGFLATAPNEGDALRFGYGAPNITTTLEYHAPTV